MKKITKLEIVHDDNLNLDFILSYITKLVEQGYTSGGEGTIHWDLETNDIGDTEE